MPSREQYLKWASGISWTFITRVEAEDIEALCERVWNEAISASTKVVNEYIGADPIMERLEQLKQGETK